MAYSAISKPSLHFNTKLYTGNATNPTTISGIGFQPDWVWTKLRSGGTEAHRLCDAVRGATKDLFSNATDAEATNTIGLKSFNADGYVIGNSNGYNLNTGTFVSWNWKANGAGSANTDGSINTTATSVNTTAGFSISKYTGTGSNATVGHGLGVAPNMVLVKSLSGGGDWTSYHSVLGNTKYMRLNSNIAAGTQSSYWNDTSPTSTVFSIGTAGDVNSNGTTYIAYCFAEKKGFSKFGSYTGNGSADGTFIYTGFKPAWVMTKASSAAGQSWHMQDNKRDGFNYDNKRLFAESSSSESSTSRMDLLSNGFKYRDGDGNGSGITYIYLAFAEQPLVANVGASIPATAR